ncbi:transposase [Psychromonas sp. MB-3u-54]|uniref:RNA-guided endonuclease InsQ/TnpB family protein n=1 Tax=Psychromonas sp. MB-3u-54 TaxID=2058319 RepID=UPI000C321D57|nr:RNA-guided endonuclease TnpB family protein [Psychromonas sp. MB-3u-54]PKH01094.1 transposase [Psychromonas sp. MB-3u-54]
MREQANVIKTLKVRVKDKHKAILNRMAFETNQVWNAANAETSEWCYIPIPEVGYIRNNISAFDLQKWLKGIKKARGFIIPAVTVQEIIAVHAKARKQFKKDKLKWRASGGARRSLGFVPFKSTGIKWINGQVKFGGFFINVWDSYGLSKYNFKSGSFSEDSRGRWYFNIVVEVPQVKSIGIGEIGIDLGLKTTATCSDGTQLARKAFYRNSESKLGKAQRANKKKQVKSIHAKIKNQRNDAMHKFSTELVRNNGLIVIGNVSSSALAKTKMAKSVLDAGWHMLKTQLDYKSKGMLVEFVEVNEKYTTQMCSCCGEITANSPKGRTGLGIREWSCAECGTVHDRDINAAKNILRLGHQTLAVGIPAF